MPYIYWDSTYILVVIGAVICMIASARVKTCLLYTSDAADE